MSKTQNVTPEVKSTKPTTLASNVKPEQVLNPTPAEQKPMTAKQREDERAAEQPKPKAEKTKVDAPAEPKVTPVEERLYELVIKDGEPKKFRGKQRQIVYDVLRASAVPLTIAQIAKVATKMELTAVGGVEPSVRYHLHQMTTDGDTRVTNPTIEIK